MALTPRGRSPAIGFAKAPASWPLRLSVVFITSTISPERQREPRQSDGREYLRTPPPSPRSSPQPSCFLVYLRGGLLRHQSQPFALASQSRSVATLSLILQMIDAAPQRADFSELASRSYPRIDLVGRDRARPRYESLFRLQIRETCSTR